jgi:hypothetical protein
VDSLSAPAAAAFPDALTGTPNWVGYIWEVRDGSRTKVPKNPHTGQNAKSNDPTTWTDFQTARNFARKHGYGLGFMLTAPFVGVDLDHCRDPETGELSTLAASVLSGGLGDTYAEVSVSGTGIKAIAYGEKPGTRCRKDGLALEIYSEKRMFALTGQRLDTAPLQITDCREAVNDLYVAAFGQPTTAASHTPPAFVTDDDDRAVIDWLTTHNAKFAALWSGDTGAYNGDHSAADLSLCSMFAFRTGDENRIDQLFRQSGLYRPKWERGDYRHHTITKAMQQGRFFTPPSPPRSTVDRPPVPADGDPNGEVLQHEIARLQAELAKERDHRTTVHALLTNAGMTPAEKLIAYALVFEVASAASRGEVSDADPEARPVNCTAIGKRIGMGHAAVAANIKRFHERGQLRAVSTPKATTDGKTFPEIAVRLPGATVIDNLRTVATWTRPEGTPHVGGAGRRCPKCHSTAYKRTERTVAVLTTKIACADCGHVHEIHSKEVAEAKTYIESGDFAATPPMLDLAAMRGVATRSTVDRHDATDLATVGAVATRSTVDRAAPPPATVLATVGGDVAPTPIDHTETVERPPVDWRPTPIRSTVDRDADGALSRCLAGGCRNRVDRPGDRYCTACSDSGQGYSNAPPPSPVAAPTVALAGGDD